MPRARTCSSCGQTKMWSTYQLIAHHEKCHITQQKELQCERHDHYPTKGPRSFVRENCPKGLRQRSYATLGSESATRKQIRQMVHIWKQHCSSSRRREPVPTGNSSTPPSLWTGLDSSSCHPEPVQNITSYLRRLGV